MKFGQYELLERVAVGGMAEVYRGRVAGAEGFEKWVAIKRILPEFARDERFISMMLTEARIHSALSHRNIVQIHDLGISEDGEYFIVLEYVEGHDLRAIMEAATDLGVQIPDSLALHVADELAQALHFAHELTDPEGQPLGIIHRDVSPSNVLISNSGEVKLSDFGIAKRRHDHSFVGSLKGNLVYMSPEQARRVPLDRRTDVFSLGAVLFEMLTGHKVRDITDEVSGFRDVASGVVRSARSLRPDLPQAYEELLSRALASNPADRFQDAAAFGAAIRELGREREAPVGPTDMKELIEVLNPPRRARSPVERSKVIRLGPEFKALAGHARGGRASGGASENGAEQPPVILAPGVVPVSAPADLAPAGLAPAGLAPAGLAPAGLAPAGLTNGNAGSHAASHAPANGGGSGWSDSPAGRLAEATPLPATPRQAEATPPPDSFGIPTPPPPAASVSRSGQSGKSAKSGRLLGSGSGRNLAQFDAAEAALNALEFSAGNEMEPTPPPPAVLGPFAPDVVTPVATPRPSGRLPVERPPEHPAAHILDVPMGGHAPVDFNATDMAMSMPTPPPRTSTASYPGVNGNLHGNVNGSANGTGTIPGLPSAQLHQARSGYGGDSSGAVSVQGGGDFAGGAPSQQRFPLSAGAPLTSAMPMAPRRRSWMPALLVFLAIVAGAAAVVHYKFIPLDVLAVWRKPATLVVSSQPGGATVTLDGRPLPQPTPTQMEVRRDRSEHILEFARPGSLPVRTTVRFDRSVSLSESVSLPAEPTPPPPPPAPVPEPAMPPAAAAAEPVPAPPASSDQVSKKQSTKLSKKAARKAAKASAAKATSKATSKTTSKATSKKAGKAAKKATAAKRTKAAAKKTKKASAAGEL